MLLPFFVWLLLGCLGGLAFEEKQASLQQGDLANNIKENDLPVEEPASQRIPNQNPIQKENFEVEISDYYYQIEVIKEYVQNIESQNNKCKDSTCGNYDDTDDSYYGDYINDKPLVKFNVDTNYNDYGYNYAPRRRSYRVDHNQPNYRARSTPLAPRRLRQRSSFANGYGRNTEKTYTNKFPIYKKTMNKDVEEKRWRVSYPETNCDYDSFKCDGFCVPLEYRCQENNPYQRQTCSKVKDLIHIECFSYFCRKNFLACDGGKTCYHQSKKCDQYRDCRDGQDEKNCYVHPTRPTRPQCSSDVHCYDGRCLERHEFCDGVRHCTHGEDEWACGKFYHDERCYEKFVTNVHTYPPYITTTQRPVFVCPSGTVKVGRKCLIVTDSQIFSWQSALDKCQQNQAILVEIQNNHFFDILRQYLTEQNINLYSFWVGATDERTEGTWSWAGSNTGVIMTDEFWADVPSFANDGYSIARQATRAPDGGYKENCGFLGYCSKTQKLDDHDCQLLKGFICQKDGYYH